MPFDTFDLHILSSYTPLTHIFGHCMIYLVLFRVVLYTLSFVWLIHLLLIFRLDIRWCWCWALHTLDRTIMRPFSTDRYLGIHYLDDAGHPANLAEVVS